MESLKETEEAGAMARKSGIPATACPYCFCNTKFFARLDYDGFERELRVRLDAWMRGWIRENKFYSPGKVSPIPAMGKARFIKGRAQSDSR